MKNCDICYGEVPPIDIAIDKGYSYNSSMLYYGRKGEEFKPMIRCPSCVQRYGRIDNILK